MNSTRTSVSIEEFSSNLTYIELVFIGVILIIICAVTVIGNALVLTAFILNKKLRTLSNYFILSLAVADIMIGAFSMPLFTVYLLVGEWTLGPVVCDMWLAQDYTCNTASCLNLLMIAIDRYFSITDPLRYRAKRTAKRVWIMISCVWIISFLLWPPWIYAWPFIEGVRTVPADDCYVQFLETNTSVTIITIVVDYYIPLSLILVLYYKIWRATRKRRKYLDGIESGYQSESMSLQTRNSPVEENKKGLSPTPSHGSFSNCNNDQDDNNESHEDDKDAGTALFKNATPNGLEPSLESEADNQDADHRHADLPTADHYSTFSDQNAQSKTSAKQKGRVKHDKAARVLTVILLAFIITTIPYNVIVVIMHLDSSRLLVSDAVWNFFYYFFYINSTFNPLCYALANKKFRMTFWRILTCSWGKKPQGTYSISSSNNASESKISYNARHLTSSLK